MGNVKWDDTLEVQLNKIICQLDEHPIICTDPVEESSYLKYSLYTSEEGFQQGVEVIYHSFMMYLDTFIKECSRNNTTKTLLLPTLVRLLTFYNHAQYRFSHSPLRSEWKQYAKNFIIFNPTNNYTIAKKEKYTRWAYNFFYKTSSIQLYFIEKLVEDLKMLYQANNDGKDFIVDSEIEQKSITIGSTPNKEYFFIIRPAAEGKINGVLHSIHKHLKKEGYINCSFPQFKAVFTTKNPQPIIWCKDYISLSYLIKQMMKKILKKSRNTANYDTAIKYFYHGQEGVYFNIKSARHDNDPNKKDKLNIEGIVTVSTLSIH